MKTTNCIRFLIAVICTMYSMTVPAFSAINVTAGKPLPVRLQLEPEYVPEPDDEGHRAPSRLITATITPEGIVLPEQYSQSITLYEVYDENGEPLVEFSSESDFIDYVYASDSDVLEIRLHLDGYILRGFLYK